MLLLKADITEKLRVAPSSCGTAMSDKTTQNVTHLYHVTSASSLSSHWQIKTFHSKMLVLMFYRQLTEIFYRRVHVREE